MTNNTTNNTKAPKDITFFERFESDILTAKKTITIRDTAESYFEVGSEVQASTFEDNRWFCALKILSVTPINVADLSDDHAAQENMTLAELKAVIGDIYPGTTDLFVIEFSKFK
ncbi:N(4)-acetylcytidine aminohydrolase [Psychrosphaera haliotis]|uniref:N(4)-acetylcytidine aminohydrolase n=1 Tax=Psychrosphaera haliotis TaxID=555083 RepID=UPI0031D30E56